MKKSLWLGGLVGGVIFFAWGALSHMMMPWHEMSYKWFTPDEEAVGQALMQNAPEDGMYLYPMGDCHDPSLTDEQREKAKMEAWDRMSTGPFALVVFQKNGTGGMGKLMGLGLLFNVLSGILIAWLLLKTSGLSLMGKAGFVAVISIVASLIVSFPEWIWWGYPTFYTLVNLADTAFGWFLAGLGMAKVMK